MAKEQGENGKGRHNPYRKIQKPLVEKKRRDRINQALEEMKELVLSSVHNKTQDKKLEKMEKADILEMTVNHLRQERQLTDTGDEEHEKYQAGFAACAEEVASTLSGIQGMNSEVKERIKGHLLQWIRSRADSPSLEVKKQDDNQGILHCVRLANQTNGLAEMQQTNVSIPEKLPSFDVFRREEYPSRVTNQGSFQQKVATGRLSLEGRKNPSCNTTVPVLPLPAAVTPLSVAVAAGTTQCVQIASLPSPVNLTQQELTGGSAVLPTQGATVVYLSPNLTQNQTITASNTVAANGNSYCQTQQPKQNVINYGRPTSTNDKNYSAASKHTVLSENTRNIPTDNSVQALKPVHFVRSVTMMKPTSEAIPRNSILGPKNCYPKEQHVQLCSQGTYHKDENFNNVPLPCYSVAASLGRNKENATPPSVAPRQQMWRPW